MTKTNIRRVLGLAAVAVALMAPAACRQKAPERSGLGLPTRSASRAYGLLDSSYAVPCYIAQGGASIVVDTGCTLDATNGTLLGATTNDLNGAALVLDPGGTSNLQATANFAPILTLGGTPTAASFTVKNSAGTPVAVIRGSGELSALNALVAATAAPLAGVASTAVAPAGLLQPVSMATAGTVPITIPATGNIMCIWNTGSEVVTIADTGNQVLSASGALGQYDVLCGFSDGTRFIEFARSNN